MPLFTIPEETEQELALLKLKRSPSHHRIKEIKERPRISYDTFFDPIPSRLSPVTPPISASPSLSESPLLRGSSPISFFQEDPRYRITRKIYPDRVETTVGKVGIFTYYRGSRGSKGK